MFINKPPRLEKQVGATLSAILAGEHFEMNALYTLELLPDLVHDPEIKQSLLRLTAHPWPAVRWSVGSSLAKASYREGVQCLTWCAMGVHPTLNHVQRGDYHDIRGLAKKKLFSFVNRLDGELVHCLVNDLKDPQGNYHIDLLSAAPFELVALEIQPLLASKDNRLRAAAACIIARNGREDVRPILENEINEGRNVELALLGLSHIPNERAIGFLEHYSREEHSPYRQGVTDTRRIRLQMLAKRRHHLLENPSANSPTEALRRFFCKEYAEYSRDSSRTLLYHVGSRTGFASHEKDENCESTADFVCEFLRDADRSVCVAEQLEAMKLVRKSPEFQPRRSDVVFDFLLGLVVEPKGKFLPGVTLFFDDPDFDLAATDWIKNAERYRVGTLSEF